MSLIAPNFPLLLCFTVLEYPLFMINNYANRSSERFESCSRIIPDIICLERFLDGKYQLADPKMFDGLTAMKTKMKEMTKKYLLDVYCDDTNMILATFLDPR